VETCRFCATKALHRRDTDRVFVIVDVIRWDEKAGLRRDAIRSQVIDALEAQEIKETGNEEE
jgi:hypothetical protein